MGRMTVYSDIRPNKGDTVCERAIFPMAVIHQVFESGYRQPGRYPNLAHAWVIGSAIDVSQGVVLST